ncbi:MAG: ATP-binding cassette domain-containing protein [Sediminimonas qiaohouensis]|uniref:ATP-binding cassette domain-containing protein n=1 Tax=Sediminimonas qiaohouensis TaxID=552061 RepID=A0A7C9LL94_9RHOB|nr:ATP-binding cassette domain-containing protein [Sediminimonas qiaohouensis]MTJ04559.1 ATP-binding cassette domain-containing protein [Sediminimonas qiaohouensis]
MLTLEAIEIRQGDFHLSADLSVADGARVALIGPSGAGKSTLLSVIAGFFPPVSGRVLWDGQDITNLPPAQRKCGILFQDNNLFPHFTAKRNVGLGIRPDLRLSAEDHQEVARALDRVGLTGLGDRKPAQLSGGQQVRVALARVLVQRKPLVLLDEPFAALGPALKAEMLDLVQALMTETGATLLMVSHDPLDAQRIAPETILVADGRASAPCDTKTLLATPPEALRRYLGT